MHLTVLVDREDPIAISRAEDVDLVSSKPTLERSPNWRALSLFCPQECIRPDKPPGVELSAS